MGARWGNGAMLADVGACRGLPPKLSCGRVNIRERSEPPQTDRRLQRRQAVKSVASPARQKIVDILSRQSPLRDRLAFRSGSLIRADQVVWH
jgi:hypothetical protein